MIRQKNNLENEKSKKSIWIIFIILLILFLLLVFFFISKYLITKNKIDKMFDEIKEVDPDNEFETASFSLLVDACLNKSVGEFCEYFLEDKKVSGTCVLSSENESICRD